LGHSNFDPSRKSDKKSEKSGKSLFGDNNTLDNALNAIEERHEHINKPRNGI